MAEITVSREYEGIKIERFIKRLYPGFPMSLIFRLLRKGKVRVNKKHVRNNFRLKEGDMVILHLPPDIISSGKEEVQTRGRFVLQSSDIIFENDDFLAINKPSGFSVHGGEGHSEDVILMGIYNYIGYEDSSLRFPPTPAHRLDIETSGVLIFAKKYEFLRGFNDLQRERMVRKEYITLVSGEITAEEMRVRLPVIRKDRPEKNSVGKEGESIFRRIDSSHKFLSECGVFSLLSAEIKTGRTHQIRSHLMQKGLFPVGDKLYGDPKINLWAKKVLGLKRQFLHSYKLSFTYDGEDFDLLAPLTDDLIRALDMLDIRFKS